MLDYSTLLYRTQNNVSSVSLVSSYLSVHKLHFRSIWGSSPIPCSLHTAHFLNVLLISVFWRFEVFLASYNHAVSTKNFGNPRSLCLYTHTYTNTGIHACIHNLFTLFFFCSLSCYNCSFYVFVLFILCSSFCLVYCAFCFVVRVFVLFCALFLLMYIVVFFFYLFSSLLTTATEWQHNCS
jgi:hypothetical protein